VAIGVVAGVAADGCAALLAGEAALVFVTGVELVALAGAPAAPAALAVAGTATLGLSLAGAASAPHAASAHTIEAAKAREAALRIGIPMLPAKFVAILASTLTKSSRPTESSQRSRRSMARGGNG
jgi:hypothetical protein